MDTRRIRCHCLPLIIPLLLLLAPAPGLLGHTLQDGTGRLWRADSLMVGLPEDGGTFQIRVSIRSLTGPVGSPYYVTDVGDGLNSLTPRLFLDGTQMWVIWSQERSAGIGRQDIYCRRLSVEGPVGNPVRVTKPGTDPYVSDLEPCAVASPGAMHVVFTRQVTQGTIVFRQARYVNDIAPNYFPSSGGEVVAGSPGRDATEPRLLIGNDALGFPLMVLIKEWSAQQGLGGGIQYISTIVAKKRLANGDPNPWYFVLNELPDNPD